VKIEPKIDPERPLPRSGGLASAAIYHRDDWHVSHCPSRRPVSQSSQPSFSCHHNQLVTNSVKPSQTKEVGWRQLVATTAPASQPRLSCLVRVSPA